MEFVLNDGTSQFINYESTSASSLYTFTIPSGYEFIGLNGRSGPEGWTNMRVYITCATPADSGITFDLSNINGKFQTVSAGAIV